MKKNILEFFRRGLIACGFGPIVLAILYLVLQHHGVLQTLTINQVCLGIFSLSALAFIASGMNVIYQVECLPLMVEILIHGGVLYIIYLGTYLLNGWLEWGDSSYFGFFRRFYCWLFGDMGDHLFNNQKKHRQAQ